MILFQISSESKIVTRTFSVNLNVFIVISRPKQSLPVIILKTIKKEYQQVLELEGVINTELLINSFACSFFIKSIFLNITHISISINSSCSVLTLQGIFVTHLYYQLNQDSLIFQQVLFLL